MASGASRITNRVGGSKTTVDISDSPILFTSSLVDSERPTFPTENSGRHSFTDSGPTYAENRPFPTLSILYEIVESPSARVASVATASSGETFRASDSQSNRRETRSPLSTRNALMTLDIFRSGELLSAEDTRFGSRRHRGRLSETSSVIRLVLRQENPLIRSRIFRQSFRVFRERPNVRAFVPPVLPLPDEQPSAFGHGVRSGFELVPSWNVGCQFLSVQFFQGVRQWQSLLRVSVHPAGKRCRGKPVVRRISLLENRREELQRFLLGRRKRGYPVQEFLDERYLFRTFVHTFPLGLGYYWISESRMVVVQEGKFLFSQWAVPFILHFPGFLENFFSGTGYLLDEFQLARSENAYSRAFRIKRAGIHRLLCVNEKPFRNPYFPYGGRTSVGLQKGFFQFFFVPGTSDDATSGNGRRKFESRAFRTSRS